MAGRKKKRKSGKQKSKGERISSKIVLVSKPKQQRKPKEKSVKKPVKKKKPVRKKKGDTGEYKVVLQLDRLTSITQKQKIKEIIKRQKKTKLRLFGKLGKPIKKKDIPDEPNINISNFPKKLSRRKRNVYGFIATIRGAYINQNRKEVFVNKRGLFVNTNRNASPITFESAQKRVSEFAKRLERKYRGRISIVDIEIKPITEKQ